MTNVLDAAGSSSSTNLKELIAALLTGEGRSQYRLVVEGGKLLEIAQDNLSLSAGVTIKKDSMSMEETARELRHSYHWLSRNWKRIGLTPKSLGRVLFFNRKQVEGLICNLPSKKSVGRPKKIVGIIPNAKS